MRTKKERMDRRRSVRKRKEKMRQPTNYKPYELPEGLKVWDPKPGAHKIDIISFIAGKNHLVCDEGEEAPDASYFVHKNVGPKNKDILCIHKHKDEPCPVCEYVQKLKQQPDYDDDLVRALSRKRREMYLIRDLSDGEYYLWESAYYNSFGEMLENRMNSGEEGEYDLYWAYDEGLSLRVIFEEKSFRGHLYSNPTSIDFKPRAKQYTEAQLKKQPCLDGLFTFKSASEIESILFGEDDVPKQEEEEEEAPKPKKRRRRRPDPEPEPEPEPEKEEVEEVEEEVEDEDNDPDMAAEVAAEEDPPFDDDDDDEEADSASASDDDDEWDDWD